MWNSFFLIKIIFIILFYFKSTIEIYFTKSFCFAQSVKNHWDKYQKEVRDITETSQESSMTGIKKQKVTRSNSFDVNIRKYKKMMLKVFTFTISACITQQNMDWPNPSNSPGFCCTSARALANLASRSIWESTSVAYTALSNAPQRRLNQESMVSREPMKRSKSIGDQTPY